MLNHLDIRTLALTLVLFCWLYALGLFLSSLNQEKKLCSRLWAASIACEGAGFLLLGLREFIPIFLSIIVANLLLVTGMILAQCGIEVFRGKKSFPPWWHATLLLLVLVLFMQFTFIDPNVNARISIISVILGLQSLICARLFMHNTIPLPRWMAIAVFTAFGGFMLMRSILTLLETSIPDFMQAGVVHALALLAYLLFVSGKAFSCIWIHNEEMNQNLRILARTDGLTGVLNRRTLFEELDRELERISRLPRSLALVMLDIDHFKAINDRYGHGSGDHALKVLAECLRQELRGVDLIGRYGGEEFILVLPDADAKTATRITERIRAKIASKLIKSPTGEFSITASFGIAFLGIHGTDADTLTQAADRALYTAKSEGRNRVTIEPSTPESSNQP